MTRYLKTGSKTIRKETFKNFSDKEELITDRKIYIIVDSNHKPVFHSDGHLLLFYNKRVAMEYLEDNDVPENWRPLKALLQITK